MRAIELLTKEVIRLDSRTRNDLGTLYDLVFEQASRIDTLTARIANLEGQVSEVRGEW